MRLVFHFLSNLSFHISFKDGLESINFYSIYIFCMVCIDNRWVSIPRQARGDWGLHISNVNIRMFECWFEWFSNAMFPVRLINFLNRPFQGYLSLCFSLFFMQRVTIKATFGRKFGMFRSFSSQRIICRLNTETEH